MTPERWESIATGVGAFVLVEALGAALTVGALLGDQYLIGSKPTWEVATVGATVTTILAALVGWRMYSSEKLGESRRAAERERVRGIVDV